MSSDSTSWQITLAKSLSSLRSQLAPCLLESVSALEKQGTSSEPFPKEALAILLAQSCLLSHPISPTGSKGRQTMKDAPHVIDMSPFCFPSKGLHYLHEGGWQNGSRFYHYWSVYHLSLVVVILWDDLSPWRKRYSSLKLSTLPVRVLVMFLLYSVLTPVIFYFFREKCAR